MFDIAFIADEPLYVDDDGWSGLWARIVLGDFVERFVAPIGFWGRVDYERQWSEGASRLVDGADESAFVEEAGRTWWTAWREGSRILVQQRLLVAESMAPARAATAADMPYHLVGTREEVSEDGESLSQWSVSVADLRDFIERRTVPIRRPRRCTAAGVP
jgi:hypothetical protein